MPLRTNLPLTVVVLLWLGCSRRGPTPTEENLGLLAGRLPEYALACGVRNPSPVVTIILSAESCFSCVNIGRAIREVRGGGNGHQIAIATLTPDTAAVCYHLRREGLADVPVMAIPRSAWNAPWPPHDLWVAFADSSGRYVEYRLARQARAGLLTP